MPIVPGEGGEVNYAFGRACVYIRGVWGVRGEWRYCGEIL